MPTLVVTGGVFSLTGQANLSGVGVISVVTGGIFDVWNTLTFTNQLDMRGGQFGNNGNGLTIWNGPVSLNGASNWIRTFYGSVYMGGPISGTGQLVNLGQNLLTLAGPNTYSGMTIITNGAMQYDNLAASPRCHPTAPSASGRTPPSSSASPTSSRVWTAG